MEQVNNTQAQILELSDKLDQLQRQVAESPLYTLPPFPTDDRIPLASAVEVISSLATSGATKVVLRFIRPMEPGIDHFEVWVRRTAFQNENPYQVASVDDSPAAFTITTDQDTAAVIYVRTVMTNGLTTDLASSPTVACNVYKFVATADDIADGAVGDSKFDRVTANKIAILAADIATLVVGGAGLGVPGQLFVKDGSNNTVAWAGVSGGYYGIWAANIWCGGTGPANANFFVDGSAQTNLYIYSGATLVAWAGTNGAYTGMWAKKFWCGGANPSNAPFYVDSSGNVIIDNTGTGVVATFKLVANDLTTTLNNGLVSSYYMCLHGLNTSGYEVQLSTTRLAMLASSSIKFILVTAPTNSALEIYNSSTTAIKIRLEHGVLTSGESTLSLFNDSGATYKLATDSGLTIAGSVVINTSKQFVGEGVLTTTGGIGGVGFNVYQSGWYYGVTGPTTFTTVDGKTVTVRGGVVTSIV